MVGCRDVLAAEMMAGCDLLAAFIHQVQDQERTLTSNPCDTKSSREKWWRSHNIYFVRNYVHAAIIAFELEMISRTGLQKVCSAARSDFHRMVARRPADFNWTTVLTESHINDDLELAERDILLEPVERVSLEISERISSELLHTPKSNRRPRDLPAAPAEDEGEHSHMPHDQGPRLQPRCSQPSSTLADYIIK